MEKVLKYSKANVCVKDKETNKILFEDSNLFVDIGRVLIAEVFAGISPGSPLNPLYWVCDLGDDATDPTTSDADLVNYLNISIAVEAGYPIILAGSSTGVHFNFEYVAAGDTTIRELGLFYRPDPAITDSFPDRHSVTPVPGYLVARLKTTYSSIFVGSGKTITIDWKIIF
jgi:hypothetical protein